MQNSEFEKKVQQKIEELKLTPADVVWEKVEAELPKEKKRPWIVFLLLFAGLAAGSLIFMNQYKDKDKKIVTDNIAAKKNVLESSVAPNSIDSNKEKSPNKTIVLSKNEVMTNMPEDNSKQNFKSASLKIKIKQGNVLDLSSTPETDLITKNKNRLKIKGKTNVSIKNQAPASLTEEIILNKPADSEGSTIVKKIIDADTASLLNNKLNDEIELPVIKKTDLDAIPESKKDTALPTSSSKKTGEKKNNLKWLYWVNAAAGISTVKNSLFSDGPVFLDAFANAISLPPPNPQVRVQPANPSKSGAFSFGLYAQKIITDKWKFTTGLNYLYQSNIIKIGNRVDSMTNYNYDVNKNIAAEYYYKTGNNASYKNKVHLIEIPLLFHYKFFKKSSLFIEAGPSLAFLIQSNALVYNSNSAAYFTDRAIFNKLLLSFNTGAGIDLAQKTKLPFSIGYHFNYGISSVTKKSFGKQHLVSSLVYLKIPIKK
jgi:hypothetical protein